VEDRYEMEKRVTDALKKSALWREVKDILDKSVLNSVVESNRDCA